MSLYITGTKDFSLSKELENKLNKAFLLICNEEEISNSSVNLKILGNTDIQQLNKKYRRINNPTNVLSFTNEDISKSITGDLGDIAISYEYVIEESAALNKEYDDHIIHMLIHGIYHILGFDHENDNMAKTMEDKEIALLSKLKITNPYI